MQLHAHPWEDFAGSKTICFPLNTRYSADARVALGRVQLHFIWSAKWLPR